MFKHILLPLDGSDTSKLALAKAQGLAKAFGAAVTAIYVLDPYPFAGVGTEFAYGQDQYFAAAKAEANTALDAARATLEAGGVPTNTLSVDGHSVHRSILETAQSVDADLIVMGSHGRGAVKGVLLGSVSSKVIAQTDIPVTIVR